MSLFTGKKTLRHQFAKLTFTDLTPAINLATSLELIRFQNMGRLAFLDNTLTDVSGDPVDVALYLVHPEATALTDDFKLFWIELPGLRVINYSVGDVPGIAFDPGTRIYVHTLSVPTAGALRLSAWG